MSEYFFVLKRGQEITEEIKKFCRENNITSAYVSAIGAVSLAEIGIYDFNKRDYDIKKFEQALELTNLTGNISVLDNEIFLHAHATFSDRETKAIGGHLMSAVVSITCEVFLVPLKEQLTRKFDEETGLKLIS